MAMSADEMDRRFATELAWFEEHCPNPRQWMDEHSWSPQSVGITTPSKDRGRCGERAIPHGALSPVG